MIIQEEHNIDFFKNQMPNKPYCTNNLDYGFSIRNKAKALEMLYLQANQPAIQTCLLFDLDKKNSFYTFEKVGLPIPHFITKTPKTGRCHYGYMLKAGVCKTQQARLKPLKYAAAVERALCHALDADVRYSGLICKNPLNAHWQVAVWEENSYTLDWLADCLDMNASEARSVDYSYGLGRNCQLFEKTRQWAYRAIRQGYPDYPQWLEAATQRVEAYNLQLTTPLSPAECATIGKSVAKWTYQRFTEKGWLDWVAKTHTPEIQAVRGRKGGKIGGKLSKRKPVADSERTLQPWLELGISQRTYYRRKNGSR